MPEFDIRKSFADVDVNSDDIVMIHGDAGVAAQYLDIKNSEKLDHLICRIKEYFSPNGTILVPAFTYSFTKGEDYHIDKTESSVGLFSERFRQGRDVIRTSHPIFSVSVWGKNGQFFLNKDDTDCFGSGTFFEELLNRNVKLVTLGCDLDTVTFVHYVEQKARVSYRYFKSFSGNVLSKNKKVSLDTRYFVRDLSLKTECNLRYFSANAERRRVLRCGSAGRFPIKTIQAVDFYELALELLKDNEHALIGEGI